MEKVRNKPFMFGFNTNTVSNENSLEIHRSFDSWKSSERIELKLPFKTLNKNSELGESKQDFKIPTNIILQNSRRRDKSFSRSWGNWDIR